MDKQPYSDTTPAAQAKRAWALAIPLLVDSGMHEVAARRFFGRLLSANQLTGDAMLPSVLRCIELGTGDPRAYLTRAASLQQRANSHPALLASWT